MQLWLFFEEKVRKEYALQLLLERKVVGERELLYLVELSESFNAGCYLSEVVIHY